MLLENTHRFSKLARCIGGVSKRMLAHSLHELEAHGFVLRVAFPTKPPKVEYSLTPLDLELAVHVQPLTRWVEANVSRVLEHHAWNAAMMRPDRFKAVFCLSVPYFPRGDVSIFERMRTTGHENEFYVFEQIKLQADQIWSDAAITIPGVLS